MGDMACAAQLSRFHARASLLAARQGVSRARRYVCPQRHAARALDAITADVLSLSVMPCSFTTPALPALAQLSTATSMDSSPDFVKSFLLIFFSEIGDKTFFIAVLLALRQSKGSVFLGTFGALSAMTLVSAALGEALHLADGVLALPGHLASLPVDDLLAGGLLLWFGLSTLKETYDLEEGNVKMAEEQDDAQEAIEGVGGGDFTRTVASTFALVFAAEWGDKSQLATIALAASASPVAVISGAIAGFLPICLLAVSTGEALRESVSEKAIGYVGGSLFLISALLTLASGART